MNAEDQAAEAARASEAVQAAIDAELRLLDPEVRASAERVSELLDPEFVEFGASGRRWDATSILTVTSSDASGPPITVSDLSGTELAPGIVHLTYLSDNDGRRARRSSLWRHSPTGRWMYFHQGTPARDDS